MTYPNGQYSIKAFGPMSAEKPFRVNMEYNASDDTVQLSEVRPGPDGKIEHLIISIDIFKLMDPKLHITDRI